MIEGVQEGGGDGRVTWRINVIGETVKIDEGKADQWKGGTEKGRLRTNVIGRGEKQMVGGKSSGRVRLRLGD